MGSVSILSIMAFAALCAFAAAMGFLVRKLYKRRAHIWMPAYAASFFKKRQFAEGPVHVMVLITDHFEPNHGGVGDAAAGKRISHWMNAYPEMASKFVDADGRHPRYTWFYPPHHDKKFLAHLSELTYMGWGEVEMHLHHEDDTSESLARKIEECKDHYSTHGIFAPIGSPRDLRFGFIHGMWALDNSDGGRHCGVNDELIVLKNAGCYADFTFPTFTDAQPGKINSIYYAADDPLKPKSYDTGVDVRAGGAPSGDLLMVQGPIGVYLRSGLYPKLDNANLIVEKSVIEERVDFWVRTGIHVKGRPEWRFVKLHTHGAIERDWEALTGEGAERMHARLVSRYNDGKRYVLHYVTAREAFNIIKAAEAGKTGDPGRYRDSIIRPYLNTCVLATSRYRAESFDDDGFKLDFLSDGGRVEMELKGFSLKKASGPISSVEYKETSLAQIEAAFRGRPAGEIKVEFSSNGPLYNHQESLRLQSLDNGVYTYGGEIRLSGEGAVRLRLGFKAASPGDGVKTIAGSRN